jgi:hypothetical protein
MSATYTCTRHAGCRSDRYWPVVHPPAAKLLSRPFQALGGELSRANTLRTCSLLSAPDSMTNSTATSTASRPAGWTRSPAPAPWFCLHPSWRIRPWRRRSSGSGMSANGAPFRKRPGLALDQRHVVLPVVADVPAVWTARSWLATIASSVAMSRRLVGYSRVLTRCPAHSHGTE